jgi:arylsulfatase A-like enzyme
MSRPNILVIVTDQQRVDSVGAYGSTVCRTPNMDKVAKAGMRFDKAFTPTGLCSPVRCSLLSGVYPHEHRVLTNVGLHPVRAQLEPADDRMSAALKSAGYRMGYVGKWHVSKIDPPGFGYEDYVSLGDYMTWRQDQGLAVPDAFNDYLTQRAVRDEAPADKSRPAFLADNAIRLIDKHHAGDDPFFLRLDFHGPHFPNVVPEPYFSMYDPADIPQWPNNADTLQGKPSVQSIKQKHWRTENLPWADWAKLISAYYGEITMIDDQVGRVLDHLTALGLDDDTLVIWTSDHGDTIGAHGICNKDYTMYEEIYRVPMLMRWPGVIPQGSTCDAFVHHFLDICGTVMEIAGAERPDVFHGRSLLSQMKGAPPPDDWPDSAYCEFHGSHMGLYSMRLLTTDDWAYIYHTNDIDELYDRKEDPWQMVNLAESKDHADVLDMLKRKMVGWMADTNDHLHNEWTVDWLTKDPELIAQAPGRRRTKW